MNEPKRIIDAIKLMVDLCHNGMDKAKDVDECCEIVRKTINAQHGIELPESEKWVPCSERMPKETVLFCDIDGDVYIGHYNKICNFWLADFNDDKVKSVVAWMPLPKPYLEQRIKSADFYGPAGKRE